MFIGIMSLIMTGGSDSDVIIATLTGFGWVYAFVVAIPSIAVVVRRLHDTGRSGGYYFISFIPLIGSIWLLALMCQEGDYGDNAYGPDPKKV